MVQQWDTEHVALEEWLYNQYSFRHPAPDEIYKSKQGMGNVKTVAQEERNLCFPTVSWLGNFRLVFMILPTLCLGNSLPELLKFWKVDVPPRCEQTYNKEFFAVFQVC